MTNKEVAELDHLLRKLAAQIHQTARDKGWWEKERNVGELYMLTTSELAEAFEEWRHGREKWYSPQQDGRAKPEGERVEIADAIIRLLDYATNRGFPLVHDIVEKMDYNTGRPHRHGGLRA